MSKDTTAQFAAAPAFLKDTTAEQTLRQRPIPTGPIPDVSKVKIGFDYQDEIKKMGDSAKQDVIRIEEILPQTSLKTTTGLIDVDITLLQQARGHVQKREYSEALNKLEAYLAKQPRHPEALYLKALCLLNTDKRLETLDAQIKALDTLAQIGDGSAEKALADLVVMLKTKICGQLYIKFPILMVINADRLLSQISEMMRLDPQRPEYYAFKAIILMERQKVPEAYDSVQEGIRIAGNNVPPILKGLKANLESEMLNLAFRPAILLFKKGEYDKSRKTLGKIEDRFKGTPEYRLFDAYLKKFSGSFLKLGSRKKISDVRMDGAQEDRNRLQFLIARDEIALSQKHMGLGDYVGAERILVSALQFVPDFPYVCFLIAGCRFRLFNAAFAKHKLPDIDTILSELERTRHFAQLAIADSGQPAPAQLLNQIEQAIHFFDSIRAAMKKRQEEISKVNKVIQEFVAIMEKAKKGIDSIALFEELFNRMKEVKKQVEKTKTAVSGQDSKATLDQLGKAVDRNLEVLQTLNKTIGDQKNDAKIINEAGGRFKAIMDGVKGGISTESQLDTFTSDLKKLKKDLPSFKRKVITDAARKNLTGLEEAVDRNLNQADEMRGTIRTQAADRKILDQHGSEFVSIVSVLKSGQKFTSRYELQNYRSRVSTALSNARSAKNKISNQAAKDNLGQIVAQYEQILEQIDRIL
ncbi:tetratricopeptide repeat protein [bacterium]|nr:tetratricopeptide repeat protein [bacterium]